MQTFIDKLKILQGALILDGYEIDDACVKMVDRFIKDEEKEIKLALAFKDIEKIIQDEIEKYFLLKKDSILIGRRYRNIVEGRQFAHWFASYYKIGSFAYIGKRFGNVDHTTVMHSRKTINNLCEVNPDYNNNLKDIKALIINKLLDEE